MELSEVLKMPMQENDAGVDTIGEYFHSLLETLWKEGEGFSGKRPFGNSGWQYEIYHALVKNGVVSGEVDEYDDLVDFDENKCDQIVFKLIDEVFAK